METARLFGTAVFNRIIKDSLKTFGPQNKITAD